MAGGSPTDAIVFTNSYTKPEEPTDPAETTESTEPTETTKPTATTEPTETTKPTKPTGLYIALAVISTVAIVLLLVTGRKAKNRKHRE